MTIVVFLGPSLPLAQAREILPEAVFLPPAGQSDVLSAVWNYRPSIICLIDGVFGQRLSVWHKELLFALEQGVVVIGGGSIGAIRAAELDRFGMLGVGEIYELVRAGVIEDDDEVAVIHGEADEGFASLSHAMVNLRATLQLAAEEGVLQPEECDALIRLAKRIHFADRTLAAILAAAHNEVPGHVLSDAARFMSTHYVDAKARDARHVLETAAASSHVPFESTHTTVHSYGLLQAYQQDRAVQHPDGAVCLRSVASYAALHHPEFDSLNFAALNRALVLTLAEMLDVTVTADELDVEKERFRRQHRLEEHGAMQAWAASNDLDMHDVDLLIRELAVCRRLQRWLLASPRGAQRHTFLLNELRLQDTYVPMAESAAQQHALAKDKRYPGSLSDLLELHARTTGWRLNTDLKLWAEEAGFAEPEELEVELASAAYARSRIAETLQLLLRVDGENRQTEVRA